MLGRMHCQSWQSVHFLFSSLRKVRLRNLGEVIFGFGGLFLGLELMSGGMKPLRSLEAFYRFNGFDE